MNCTKIRQKECIPEVPIQNSPMGCGFMYLKWAEMSRGILGLREKQSENNGSPLLNAKQTGQSENWRGADAI